MAAQQIELPRYMNGNSHREYVRQAKRDERLASSVVNMNDLAKEAQELQEFIATLEERPLLEKALNRQLQLQLHGMKSQHQKLSVLMTAGGFLLGLLLALILFSILHGR